MKLPYLKQWDAVPFVATITSGINEFGAPATALTYTGKCSFSEKARQVRDKNGQWIQLSATLTVEGDIAPNQEIVTGYIQINGSNKKWQIQTSKRPRNPDGTVNHTALGLI